MIEVEKLTKRYGDFIAIEGVTFNVAEGEVVGFLGPNAAGKTTTMRILTCFMPATDGTARIAGYDVFDDPIEVKRRIGYMPENVPLYTEMTVKSYLSFMAKVKGVARKERRGRVNSAIEACGLENFRNRVIGKLSKGYRQRVGLAQALVHNPQVLILDEPTIGLDPRQIIEIRNLIKSLGGEHTVILSTHILPEASMICSRVIVINEGRIAGEVSLKDGRVAAIAGSPTTRKENSDKSRAVGKTDLEQSDSMSYDKQAGSLFYSGESETVYMQVRGPSDKVLARLRLTPNVSDAQLERILSPSFSPHSADREGTIPHTPEEEDDSQVAEREEEGPGDIGTYIVTHRRGMDIRAELTSMIVYSGWELLELRPVEMTLEEAFLELTREEVASE